MPIVSPAAALRILVAKALGMDLYQKLTILNSAASLLTLLFVAVAVLPHAKQGMVIVRDAILWLAFLAFLAGLAWAGWQRLSPGMGSAERVREIPVGARVDRSASSAPAPSPSAPVPSAPAPSRSGLSLFSQYDPYYRGQTP